MRRLLLLRHAKSERSLPGARDHARVLDARGRSEAPVMGAYMARHRIIPDRVLVSTAVRAQETWTLAAAAFTAAPATMSESRIYEAETQALLELLQETPANIGALLAVGHNPGFHDLAMLLIASGGIEAREQLREGLPTCGLAVIDFAFDDWRNLHAKSGRLERFVSPRSLELATD